jgi:hypothetical protein
MLKRILIILVAILFVAISIFISDLMPGFNGVVAELKLADGTQVVVEQDDNGEPYNTGFFLKQANGKWGWAYLDHEDGRWRNGKIDYDPLTDSILVWNGRTLRGKLERKTGIFLRPDVPGWQSTLMEDHKSPSFWNPE